MNTSNFVNLFYHVLNMVSVYVSAEIQLRLVSKIVKAIYDDILYIPLYMSLTAATYFTTNHRTINFRGIEYVYLPIQYIRKLDINHAPIIDVSMLSNIHTLNLHGCINVIDVSMLGNVYDLNISHTSVTDVSKLGNVHTLNLCGTLVVDVSMLSNVHTLDLSNTLVVDVSMLYNVHTLSIYTTPVIDVSALRNVRVLEMSWTQVTDVSKLLNVHTLKIEGCRQLNRIVFRDSMHSIESEVGDFFPQLWPSGSYILIYNLWMFNVFTNTGILIPKNQYPQIL